MGAYHRKNFSKRYSDINIFTILSFKSGEYEYPEISSGMYHASFISFANIFLFKGAGDYYERERENTFR